MPEKKVTPAPLCYVCSPERKRTFSRSIGIREFVRSVIVIIEMIDRGLDVNEFLRVNKLDAVKSLIAARRCYRNFCVIKKKFFF